MTIKKLLFTFFILALAGLSTPLPASAQAAFSPEKWTFEITPNFWASGLKVDAKQGLLPEQETDVSFSDIMKSVHLGLSGLFEVRKGQWGLLLDGMYVDIRKEVETPVGNVELKMRNSTFSLAGMYRAVEGRVASLDILAGARYNNMSNDLELTSGPYVGRSTSSTDDWVDGFIGARLIVALARRWALVGYADMGAGGTEITWQAMAWLDWRISRVFALKAGYRHSYFNRETGDDFFKQAKSGFYAGLGLNF